MAWEEANGHFLAQDFVRSATRARPRESAAELVIRQKAVALGAAPLARVLLHACGVYVMRGLIVGQGVVEWVAGRLGVTAFPQDTTGLGWWDYNRILMGAVYNNYNGAQIHMHLARLPGVRLSPGFVRHMLDYPFRQLKVRRITGTIAASNTASRTFAEQLGARLEGTMQDALPNDDMCVYGLLRADAERWLRPPNRAVSGVPDGLSRIGRIRQEHVAAALA